MAPRKFERLEELENIGDMARASQHRKLLSPAGWVVSEAAASARLPAKIRCHRSEPQDEHLHHRRRHRRGPVCRRVFWIPLISVASSHRQTPYPPDEPDSRGRTNAAEGFLKAEECERCDPVSLRGSRCAPSDCRGRAQMLCPTFLGQGRARNGLNSAATQPRVRWLWISHGQCVRFPARYPPATE